MRYGAKLPRVMGGKASNHQSELLPSLTRYEKCLRMSGLSWGDGGSLLARSVVLRKQANAEQVRLWFLVSALQQPAGGRTEGYEDHGSAVEGDWRI